MDNGDAEGSLQQARAVLKTVQSLNDKDLPSKQELIASLYSVIGTAQLELGETDKSLESHLKDYQLVTTNKYVIGILLQDVHHDDPLDCLVMHYPEHWTTWGEYILSREIIRRALNSREYSSNRSS